MKDMTTHEHIKDYYSRVPFTPYSSGYMLKNLFRRMFESTPSSMLIKEIRFRDKIFIHDTKAALEREQDFKKVVLDPKEDEDERKRQIEIKQKRAKLFKKEILDETIRKEHEKRVDLSEEFESYVESGDLNNSEQMPEIDEDQSESLYSKIKNKQFKMVKNKNNTGEMNMANVPLKSISRSSESSFAKDERSAATGQPGRFLKGIEESEIGKLARAESEVTSTIRGAFNQISSIVEAQDFKLNSRYLQNRDQTGDLNNIKTKHLNFNSTQQDNRLFNKVLPNDKELHSTKYVASTNTERRKPKPFGRKKMKSEAGEHLINPYRLKPSKNVGHPVSEIKHKITFEFEESSGSNRRQEFNQEVNNPHESSRL
jgi:hypothetical protein